MLCVGKEDQIMKTFGAEKMAMMLSGMALSSREVGIFSENTLSQTKQAVYQHQYTLHIRWKYMILLI